MADKTSSMVFLNYLTTVFDSINDFILLVGVEPNNQFRLLLANEPFYRITGFPRDSVGKLVNDIVGATNFKTLCRHYKDVIDSKEPKEYTEWSELPSGKLAYHVRLIPVLNSVGEVVQLAAVIQDVTELEALRNQNKQLRQKLQKPL